jgi:hypothetical protein
VGRNSDRDQGVTRLMAPLRRHSALLLLALVAACGPVAGPTPAAAALPDPTCGGVKIFIEGALPCAAVAERAIAALRERAPEQLNRGVTAIDVTLTTCPRNEVPPQVDCGAEQFAQMVEVTFGAAPPDGPIEPSLTVAVAPVSGAILGIVNPLIR